MNKMFSNKLIKLLTISLTVSSILFIYKNNPLKAADDYVRRTLLTTSDRERICLRASEELKLGFASNFVNVSSRISTFISSDEGDKKGAAALINIVRTGEGVGDYVSRVAPYFVFLAFAFISLISWFVYCGCCCRPCCCCKKGDNEGCCKFTSVVIVLVSYCGIVIGCIIGFIYATQFTQGLNGSTCAFLNFYSNIINGENTTAVPRWIGFGGIVQTLQRTVNAVDQIAANSTEAFKDNSWTQTEPQKFENKLSQAYSDYFQTTIQNPNPSPSQSGGIQIIQPNYIVNYGNYTRDGTSLNAIFQEFDKKIKVAATLINNAQDYSTQITLASDDIKQSIGSVQTEINSFRTDINKVEVDVIDQWVTYQDTFNDAGGISFFVLFAVLIGLTVLSTIGLLLYTCCKVQWARYILHAVWFIMTLIMILTFILGTVFGVIGLAGKDGVSVMQWIFSNENLGSTNPEIISSTEAAGYLNTCINLDGDLAKKVGFDTSNTGVLSELYTAASNLTEIKAQVSANRNSLAIETINTMYNNMITDITLTTDFNTLRNNDISAMLSEWQGYTDTNVNRYLRCSSGGTKDYWSWTKEKCPNSYPYLAASSTAAGPGPHCLVIPEWSTSMINSRYVNTCTPTGGDFTSVSSASTAYYNGLTQYSTSSKSILEQLISTNGELNGLFQSMAGLVLTSISNIEGILNPLIDVFQSIVGSQGLFQLINCSFIGRDLNVFFSTLQNDLAPKSTALGAVIVAVSFLQCISVFFLLIVIFKFKGDDLKNKPVAAPEQK